jgi:hypothetical protein
MAGTGAPETFDVTDLSNRAYELASPIRLTQWVVIGISVAAIVAGVVGIFTPTPVGYTFRADIAEAALVLAGWFGLVLGLHYLRIWSRSPVRLTILPHGLRLTYRQGSTRDLSWEAIGANGLLQNVEPGRGEVGEFSLLQCRVRGIARLFTLQWESVPVVYLTPMAFESTKVALERAGLRLVRQEIGSSRNSKDVYLIAGSTHATPASRANAR